MTDNLPNFIIAGAAKCGTSSLYSYLNQHPEIFLSKIKEPKFISSQSIDLPLNGPKDNEVEATFIKSFDDYKRLFASVENEVAIGEASADTLYFHKGTIPVIKKILGDPKIIIVLRNPTQRAFSAYKHLLRDGRERLSFEEGLKEESKRIKENWELIYHYTKASLYAEPVKAFLQNFTNVKIILSEDLLDDPINTLNDVFLFLGVNPNLEISTKFKINVSGKPISQSLHYFVYYDNPIKRVLRPIFHFFTNKAFREKTSHFLLNKNLKSIKMSKSTRLSLNKIFVQDILKLEQLTKIDLSKWKS